MELETWRAPYAHFIGASERAVPGGWTIVGAPFDSTHLLSSRRPRRTAHDPLLLL